MMSSHVVVTTGPFAVPVDPVDPFADLPDLGSLDDNKWGEHPPRRYNIRLPQMPCLMDMLEAMMGMFMTPHCHRIIGMLMFIQPHELSAIRTALTVVYKKFSQNDENICEILYDVMWNAAATTSYAEENFAITFLGQVILHLEKMKKNTTDDDGDDGDDDDDDDDEMLLCDESF